MTTPTRNPVSVSIGQTIMKKTMTAVAVLTATLSASTALAQTVNYGELQELFGEPVTTSATGKPQRASDAPATMIIITGDDLRRSSSTTLPQVLQNYAGMVVSRSGAGFFDVGVRGDAQPFNPTLLVMVNGRQVYLDNYGYTNWGAIGVEFDEIRQIEVVKGPNSALFGFNAAAGVVNIITVNPLYDQVNAVTGSIGDKDQRNISATATVKADDSWAFRLSAGYEKQDELSVPNSSIGNSIKKRFSLQSLAQVGPKTQLDLSYNYAQSVDQQMVSNYVIASFRTTTHGARAALVADSGIGLINASYYYNQLLMAPLAAGDPIQTRTHVVQLSDTVKLGAADTVRLSGEYRRNAIDIGNSDVAPLHYDVFAAAAMWEHVLSDSLTFTSSGRLDHMKLGYDGTLISTVAYAEEDYRRKLTDWSFNSSLVYKMDANGTVRLSAARGLQTPSLLAMALGVYRPGVPARPPRPAQPSQLISGNPTLDPSVHWSYELAYDRVLGDVAKWRSSLFYKQVKNVINNPDQNVNRADPLNPNGRNIVDAFQNVGDYTVLGIEAGLSGRFKNQLDWRVNYTWLNVDEKLDKSGYTLANATYKSMTPEHSVNVGFDWSWNKFSIGADARYRTKTSVPRGAGPGLPGTRFYQDAHFVVDARASYEVFKDVRLFVVGENIGDEADATQQVAEGDSRVRGGLAARF